MIKKKLIYQTDLNKKNSTLFNKVIKEINNNTNNKENFYNIFNSKYKFNFKISDLRRFKKYNNIAIIGMGGSILGIKAIHQFLIHKIKKNVFFFDNLDLEKNIKFKKNTIYKKTLFLIISKSGNTIETLSNSFSLNFVKKNRKNIIIISEKRNNILFNLSNKLNLYYIEHKNFIGGRYSVLSEAGVVPAFLMGIDIKKLRSRIKYNFSLKEKKYLKDSSLKLNNIINRKKITNLVFLNYAPQLENFLFWVQQLMAESLGKKGKGLLPVISNTPKDHHSLLQLYLDGPKNKLFHIFYLREKNENMINTKSISNQIKYIHNKNLPKIKKAQKNALVKILKDKKIPFREFELKKKDEQTLGELFSYFMLETILIGKLLKINPFDQPAVEQIKILTKKILEN